MEETRVATPNSQFLVNNSASLATVRQQRNTVLSLVTAFMVVLLLVQLWLLVEAVEGDFGGADPITVPATLMDGCSDAASSSPGAGDDTSTAISPGGGSLGCSCPQATATHTRPRIARISSGLQTRR